MRYWLVMSFGVATLGLSGCGPNCQSTCTKLYNEGECSIRVPGMEQEELYGRCVDECDFALRFPGNLDGYNPDDRHAESVDLKNEKQAAAWMDCVEQTACEKLDEGYCGEPG